MPYAFEKDDPFILAAVSKDLHSEKKDCLIKIIFDVIDDKLKEKCDIYLAQTIDPSVRKFGVSFDARTRAKTGRKILYKKLLSYHTIPERWQALCLESAFSSFSWHIDNYPVSNPHKYGHFHRKYGLSGGSAFELTYLDQDCFDAKIAEWMPIIASTAPADFLEKYSPRVVEDFTSKAEQLRQGEDVFAICRDKEYFLAHHQPSVEGYTEEGEPVVYLTQWRSIFNKEHYAPGRYELISVDDALSAQKRKREKCLKRGNESVQLFNQMSLDFER